MADHLTRIGIFYDGNYFSEVSHYYAYEHPRRARLSLDGLHDFIKTQVAQNERTDHRFCQIVDVHYFRGRFSTSEADASGKLLPDRRFEDVLVSAGVTTHFLPMVRRGAESGDQRWQEKGIDVWFALEAFERAIYKRFDVCVLIACDSDYIPLARKLNALGTRVMVLGWDVGKTRTSQGLLDEVPYPILVSSLIEDKTKRDMVSNLFLESKPLPAAGPATSPLRSGTEASQREQQVQLPPSRRGRIQKLHVREEGRQKFGFITPEEGGSNLYFGEVDLVILKFDQLKPDQPVEYELGENGRGICAKHVRSQRDSAA